MDPVNITAKFEVPEIIGGTQKIKPTLDTPIRGRYSWGPL